jgi:hypothetical protein
VHTPLTHVSPDGQSAAVAHVPPDPLPAFSDDEHPMAIAIDIALTHAPAAAYRRKLTLRMIEG